MAWIQHLITYAFGPRIYRIYKTADHPGKEYPANGMERMGETTMQLLSICCSVGLYTSPIVLTYLYTRSGSLTPSVSLLATIVVLFSSGLAIRGYGRYLNPEYQSFLQKRHSHHQYKHYDWDFSHWPVDFESDVAVPEALVQQKNSHSFSLSHMPCQWLSFLAVHSFGRRMLYPGSVSLLQQAMHPMLTEGRQRLVERFSGQRFKLKTADQNEIDVMLIDRRNSSSSVSGSTSKSNGQKLVICCEGNAGFYEVGIMCTPIESGYSVLGWNHPGFGGSSGLPFPGQEMHAVHAVLLFATQRLGFKQEDILLFGWSIGGFPAAWVGTQYPLVHGMILDATFDHILPLAVSKMPGTWKPLVTSIIRSYFELNISDCLSRYSGPVLLIRRLKDEIIHTVETAPIATNRANDLLVQLLSRRFPHLMREEDAHWTLVHYLSGDRTHQSRLMQQHRVKEQECLKVLTDFVRETGVTSYPLMIGETGMSDEEKTRLVLFLAAKHLLDYDSTHCTPLPRNLFQEPWNLFKEAQTFGQAASDEKQGKL